MRAPEPAADDAADTALLIAHIREAGAIARGFYGGTFKRWDKGALGPVTEADIAVDNFLKIKLRTERPDYGWLSEETEDDSSRLSRERIFVVDPIDGTRAFIKGIPEFTVVGAVVAHGRPVSAVIYNPATEELFDATLNGGAHLNGTTIHVSDKTDFENCRMLGGRRFFQRPEWNPPWPESMNVAAVGSVAYRMSLVAAGIHDAVVSISPKYDWDVAAGDLIAGEARGLVTAHDGAPFVYNLARPLQRNLVCAGPLLHRCLLERFAQVELPFR